MPGSQHRTDGRTLAIDGKRSQTAQGGAVGARRGDGDKEEAAPRKKDEGGPGGGGGEEEKPEGEGGGADHDDLVTSIAHINVTPYRASPREGKSGAMRRTHRVALDAPRLNCSARGERQSGPRGERRGERGGRLASALRRNGSGERPHPRGGGIFCFNSSIVNQFHLFHAGCQRDRRTNLKCTLPGTGRYEY